MNINLNMNNMNIKSYLKLQLKVQLHLNTLKITSYVYKKGQWASYFRKSFSSIATKLKFQPQIVFKEEVKY